ncbi:MAG: hypothetical protein NTZ78_08245 [Candidatus Aureabacteria bacterium]|nr:hypothetical protein [Candidatus Auribacterota bacterium]
MALKEAIDKVLRSETEAKNLLAGARSKEEEILADAERRAKEIVEKAVRDGTEQAHVIIVSARQEGEETRERTLAEAAERIQAEAREGGARLAEAVRKVMELLLK